MVVVKVKVDSSVLLEDHRLQKVNTVYLDVDHLLDSDFDVLKAFNLGQRPDLAPAPARRGIRLDRGDMVRPKDVLPRDAVLGFFAQFRDHPPQMRELWELLRFLGTGQPYMMCRVRDEHLAIQVLRVEPRLFIVIRQCPFSFFIFSEVLDQ